jgi:hypothetical protein
MRLPPADEDGLPCCHGYAAKKWEILLPISSVVIHGYLSRFFDSSGRGFPDVLRGIGCVFKGYFLSIVRFRYLLLPFVKLLPKRAS